MKKLFVLALLITSPAFADGNGHGSGGQGGAGNHPRTIDISGNGQGGNGMRESLVRGGAGTGGVDRTAPEKQSKDKF